MMHAPDVCMVHHGAVMHDACSTVHEPGQHVLPIPYFTLPLQARTTVAAYRVCMLSA
jgi:hypothetical protein